MTAVGMATCVLTGQVIVSFTVLSYAFRFPASNLFFALLTFPITDIIADVYGREEANRTVWIGFFSQLATIAILELCMLLPGDSDKLQPFHIGGIKVFVGSSIAYLGAQFWDVYFFHWIKDNVTGERHLWLRNNLSTFTSQVINSSIFIAFVFGYEALLSMLAGSIVVKWVLAAVDTPFVYVGCRLLKFQSADETSTSLG